MNARAKFHERYVKRLCSRLRRAGATHIVRTPRIATHSHRPPGDLLVDGRSVAVVVATPRWRQHIVTVKGKQYSYRYMMVCWNLHTHNHKRGSIDWWMFVLAQKPPRIFVVSGDVIANHGPTLTVVNDSLRASKHWLTGCENAFGVLAGRAA